MSTYQGPQQLDVFPSYKGGRTCVYGGYVYEFFPGHPLQNYWGWVAQHRLVAEDKIGRPLRQGKDHHYAEHAHHIDDCRTNNHPDNIEVMTKSAHHSHHSRQYSLNSKGAKITPEQVRAALVGRTLKETAAFLGIHNQTLRNKFPDEIAHRKRKSPTNINDPKVIEAVRALAKDSTLGFLDVAKKLGMNELTVEKIVRKNNIFWVRKSRIGETHKSYRGKPIHRLLEAHDSKIEAERQRSARRSLAKQLARRASAVQEKPS